MKQIATGAISLEIFMFSLEVIKAGKFYSCFLTMQNLANSLQNVFFEF